MNPNDDQFSKIQEQLRDGIIRDNADDFLSLRDFSTQPQPRHVRHRMTGQQRNDAEASYMATIMKTLLDAQKHGNQDKTKTILQTTTRYLTELEGQLHPVGRPYLVAGIEHTASGTPRTTTESLEVAAENFRRAVVAGRLDHARAYLQAVSTLLDKQNQNRARMRKAAQKRRKPNEG
ncbi:hypothetical protein [Deinococcus fonticola]|uniref:hypothetical protein n=1 Tax=Deinococcus fonticola TaxID=2528713 RepID=UPI00107502BF|nr:hypothetical protein [Deinococcus fonticola]